MNKFNIEESEDLWEAVKEDVIDKYHDDIVEFTKLLDRCKEKFKCTGKDMDELWDLIYQSIYNHDDSAFGIIGECINWYHEGMVKYWIESCVHDDDIQMISDDDIGELTSDTLAAFYKKYSKAFRKWQEKYMINWIKKKYPNIRIPYTLIEE